MRDIFFFILVILAVIFPYSIIALKLLGAVSWSWWIVGFSPLGIIAVLFLLGALFELLIEVMIMFGY